MLIDNLLFLLSKVCRFAMPPRSRERIDIIPFSVLFDLGGFNRDMWGDPYVFVIIILNPYILGVMGVGLVNWSFGMGTSWVKFRLGHVSG